jgi:acetylornithine aminotransferase/acetylornithine/N-succinyldiaminopimelate aminotransferase
MLDNHLPAQVAKISDYLFDRLEGLQESRPLVSGLRGKGLLVGVSLKEDLAEKVTLECLNQGLIVNAVRPNIVRLTPPLTVSEAEVDEAVAILEKTLGRVS